MATEIQQLVHQCLQKDESAVLQLVGRFRHQVHALCYRMLGQHQDAEDIVQETFVRVVRSLSCYDHQRGEFEPWLLQIAANRCRTFLARKNRRPESALNLEDLAPDHSIAHQNAANQLTEEVHLALAHFRREWREAFLYFHQNEMSYDQISERMQAPIGTVKTWVHRCRRDLIQKLKDREVV